MKITIKFPNFQQIKNRFYILIGNLFSISTFLKFAFIYIFSLLMVLLNSFQCSEDFWHKLAFGGLSKQRIALYGIKYHIGEHAVYLRNMKAAESNGYDFVGFEFEEALSEFALTKHLYYVSASLINLIFKPQLKIAITHHVEIFPAGTGKNVVYLTIPDNMLFNKKGYFLPQMNHLKNYDIYADLHSFVHGSNPYLHEILNNENLKNKQVIPLLNTAHPYTEYVEIVPNLALITGSLWGCNRGSLKFSNVLEQLAQNNMLVAYGLKEFFSFLGKDYKEEISMKNFLNLIIDIHREYGIALVTHNLEHMLEGLPTARINEAVASSSLIISDRNYFVEKYFSDNALYFDIFANSQEIYQQIKDHIEWARLNPEEVLKKTKANHEVFVKHLTLEMQLKNLYHLAYSNIDSEANLQP